jgi:hypothetical protein
MKTVPVSLFEPAPKMGKEKITKKLRINDAGKSLLHRELQ